MRISIIQSNANDDKQRNVEQAISLVEAAAASDAPDMAVLPELFTFHGGTPETKKAAGEDENSGTTVRRLRELARELDLYIHAGSLLENEGGEQFNSTFVFSPEGRIVAKYRKIHLFDVVTPDGTEYAESRSISGGDSIVTYEASGATIGCSICYDLRFPELYLALAKRSPHIIMIPSAFTMQTGKDHWEVLCRARAIEAQCYVVAPNQTGSYTENGQMRANYGHSMIVDPWGIVIAQCQDKVGFCTGVVDLSMVERVRAMIPVGKNRILG